MQPASARARSARGRAIGLPLLAGILVGGIGAACDIGGAGWQGGVDTLESGVVVVTNTGRGVWGDAAAWRLERATRIGAIEGAGPDVFGRVTAVDIGPDGRVYVLDGQAGEVRIFDREGVHRASFGGEGRGPGEFARAAWMERGPDGRLWVADILNRRLTAFDTAGGVVSTRAWGSYGNFFGAHRITESGLVEQIGLLESREIERGRVDGVVSAVVRRPLREDGADAGADTLRIPGLERPTFTVQRTLEGGVATFFHDVPYGPDRVVAIGPDGGVWVSRTDVYRLAHLTLSGDTTRVVVRPLEPTPVTDADVSRALSNAERLRDADVDLDPGLVPETRPFFTDLIVDDTGALWVRRMEDPAGVEYRAEETGEAWYDVFDPDGRFLGRLDAPVERYPTPRITGDHLVGVVRDSLDVEYVEVYRIEKE